MVKQAALVFVACVLIYLGFFKLDLHLRNRHGPWMVAFTNEVTGEPSLIISQPQLNLADIKLVAVSEKLSATNKSGSLAFDFPPESIPFGKLIFFDTTYLPGTLTFDIFGHGVELIPRTLRVDGKEIPWKSGLTIRMEPSEKTNPKPIKRKE